MICVGQNVGLRRELPANAILVGALRRKNRNIACFLHHTVRGMRFRYQVPPTPPPVLDVGRQTEFAETMQEIETGETCADNDGVRRRLSLLFCRHTFPPRLPDKLYNLTQLEASCRICLSTV